ncbi:hypothetical protein BJ165DRAFT_1411294 [Panaeolus papilionaceus]|nr:hypothetical protein BJ165DRAFT_1411294 [Panaeolus papilionaceus]
MSANLQKVDIARFHTVVQHLRREFVHGFGQGNLLEVMVRNGESMEYLLEIVNQTRMEPRSVPNKVKNVWKSKTSLDAWVFWLGLEFQNLKAAQRTHAAPLETNVTEVMGSWKKRMEEGQLLLADAAASASAAVASTSVSLSERQPTSPFTPAGGPLPPRPLPEGSTIATPATAPEQPPTTKSINEVRPFAPPALSKAATPATTTPPVAPAAPPASLQAATAPIATAPVAQAAPAIPAVAAESDKGTLSGGGKRKLEDQGEGDQQPKRPRKHSRTSSSAPKSTGGSSARQISQAPAILEHKKCDRCVQLKVDCVPGGTGGCCLRCTAKKCACSNALGASAAASQGHKNRKQKSKEVVESDEEKEDEDMVEGEKEGEAAEAEQKPASTPKVEEKKRKRKTMADLEARIVELEKQNERLRKDAEHNVEELSMALDSFQTLRMEVGAAFVGMAQDIAHAMAQAKHVSGGVTVERPTLFKSYRMERGSRIGSPSLKLHGSDFDWEYSPPTSLQPRRVSVDSDGAYSWGGRVPHNYTVQPGEVLHDVVGWACDDPTAPLAKLHPVPRHLITKNASGVPVSSAGSSAPATPAQRLMRRLPSNSHIARSQSSAPGGSSAAPRELTVNPAHLHAPASTVLATEQAAGATVTQAEGPSSTKKP